MCFFKPHSFIPSFHIFVFSYYYFFGSAVTTNQHTHSGISMKFIYFKIIYWILLLCISWWYFLYAPHNLWMFMEIFLSSAYCILSCAVFNMSNVHYMLKTYLMLAVAMNLYQLYCFKWIFGRGVGRRDLWIMGCNWLLTRGDSSTVFSNFFIIFLENIHVGWISSGWYSRLACTRNLNIEFRINFKKILCQEAFEKKFIDQLF